MTGDMNITSWRVPEFAGILLTVSEMIMMIR